MIILPPEPEPDARPGPYVGSRVVLANMHGKDTAIAPVLRARLGLVVTTAPDLDTDVLGTFTGEIPRAGTIREVAKARLGMAATGLPIGIASEGSYERMGWMPPPAGIVRCLRAPSRRVRRRSRCPTSMFWRSISPSEASRSARRLEAGRVWMPPVLQGDSSDGSLQPGASIGRVSGL